MGKVRQEQKTLGKVKVNRQDMIMYLLAEAFSNTDEKTLQKELVDIFGILAVCACSPIQEDEHIELEG